MKIIYVAGPYRADGDNGVFDNIMLARMVARKLWLMGYAVICPHLNTFFMDGPDTTFDMFMAGDLAILEKCDGIYMLPDSAHSKGAMIEVKFAMDKGIPVYHHLGELPNEKSS